MRGALFRDDRAADVCCVGGAAADRFHRRRAGPAAEIPSRDSLRTARRSAAPGRTRSSAAASTASSIPPIAATASSRTSPSRRATRGPRRVRRDVRARHARRSHQASGVLVYRVVNRGNGAPTPSPRRARRARQRLAGRCRADRRQPDDRGAGRDATAMARRSPARSSRVSRTPPGTTTCRSVSARSARAGYPPAALDTRRATLTFRSRRELAGSEAAPARSRQRGPLPTAARRRFPARPIRRASA